MILAVDSALLRSQGIVYSETPTFKPIDGYVDLGASDDADGQRRIDFVVKVFACPLVLYKIIRIVNLADVMTRVDEHEKVDHVGGEVYVVVDYLLDFLAL